MKQVKLNEDSKPKRKSENGLPELKPCPFCGGNAEYKTINAMTHAVECQKCGATAGRRTLPSYVNDRNWTLKYRAQSYNDWNRRGGEGQ